MLRVKPDFYDSFRCIASRCKHSCCLGWEIDIDKESLDRFMAVEGEFGDYIRQSIALEPTPHFMLGQDERCPFLQADGLCRMILRLGEDSICHICREHPRFYNELPGRLEAGLGLCCEEVCRLVTEGRGHIEFIAQGESEEDDGLVLLRDEIFKILRQDSLSLEKRMEKALALFGMEPVAFDAELAEFYLSLERLDESWAERLQALTQWSGGQPDMSSMAYTRLAEYFVFRHFATAADEYEAALRLQFCWLSLRIICAMDTLSKERDAARLYSSEIEYSDENVDKILDYIDGRL